MRARFSRFLRFLLTDGAGASAWGSSRALLLESGSALMLEGGGSLSLEAAE